MSQVDIYDEKKSRTGARLAVFCHIAFLGFALNAPRLASRTFCLMKRLAILRTRPACFVRRRASAVPNLGQQRCRDLQYLTWTQPCSGKTAMGLPAQIIKWELLGTNTSSFCLCTPVAHASCMVWCCDPLATLLMIHTAMNLTTDESRDDNPKTVSSWKILTNRRSLMGHPIYIYVNILWVDAHFLQPQLKRLIWVIYGIVNTLLPHATKHSWNVQWWISLRVRRISG